ncbi:hypothetical protein LIER_29397 [Lithospermum erythrorhizon]|uniref:SWIM-type domain-containing protein n=1 Tax=Lithospermum erythrorhizon TaxID=34254 RepID=A0AAV3RKK8_LITER
MKNRKNIVNESNCGCYYRRTHGIPCDHEITFTKYSSESIKLSSFHNFWKKLDIEIDHNPTEEGIRKNEFQDVWNALPKAPAPLQRQLLKTITYGLYPESENIARYFGISTTLPSSGSDKSRCSFIALTQSSLISYRSNSVHPTPNPPPIKPSQNDSPSSPSTPTSLSKGRGIFDIHTSSYSADLMSFIIPFVDGFVDVKADGNCGYRDVALHIYGNENESARVRKECCMELHQCKDFYQKIMPYEDLNVSFLKIALFDADDAPLFN